MYICILLNTQWTYVNWSDGVCYHEQQISNAFILRPLKVLKMVWAFIGTWYQE